MQTCSFIFLFSLILAYKFIIQNCELIKNYCIPHFIIIDPMAQWYGGTIVTSSQAIESQGELHVCVFYLKHFNITLFNLQETLDSLEQP